VQEAKQAQAQCTGNRGLRQRGLLLNVSCAAWNASVPCAVRRVCKSGRSTHLRNRPGSPAPRCGPPAPEGGWQPWRKRLAQRAWRRRWRLQVPGALDRNGATAPRPWRQQQRRRGRAALAWHWLPAPRRSPAPPQQHMARVTSRGYDMEQCSDTLQPATHPSAGAAPSRGHRVRSYPLLPAVTSARTRGSCSMNYSPLSAQLAEYRTQLTLNKSRSCPWVKYL
jgi:hypothetical protein